MLTAIAANAERSFSYPVQVLPGLNIGAVGTEVGGTIDGGAGTRPLTAIGVRVVAPRIGVNVIAPETMAPGSKQPVIVEVTNAGPGVARRLTVSFRPIDGADHILGVEFPEGFRFERPEVDNDTRPFDAGALILELGDVDPTTSAYRYEFDVDLSDAATDQQVIWQAAVGGAVSFTTSSPSTFVVPATAAAAAAVAPDRLENSKVSLIWFTVGVPLLALLVLALVKRWVPDISQTTTNRAMEGVLVVFLASTVLVMNLAGGLEAESAAAIIGGIGGYLFGRGISEVGSRAPGPTPGGGAAPAAAADLEAEPPDD